MKNNVSNILLSIFVFTFISFNSFANDIKKDDEVVDKKNVSSDLEIKPFGNFEWNDSLKNFLNKLLIDKKIVSISYIEVNGFRKKWPSPYTKSIKSKKDIDDIWNKAEKIAKETSFEPYKTFINKLGKKIKYFDGTIVILAEAYTIKKVKFILSAKFSSSRGFALINSSKIDGNEDYKFPLVLEELNVDSLGGTDNEEICRLNYKEINKVINEKYKKIDPKFDAENANELNPLKDSKNRELQIRVDRYNSSGYSIKYTNKAIFYYYEKEYLNNLKNRKDSTVDSSSKL